MEALKDRPPYVTFEMKPVENREKSLAQGMTVYDDVPFVLITPQGSRDQIERQADEWFAQQRQHVANGRMPAAWLSAFEAAFKAWKNDEEPPVNGTHISQWPGLPKSQYEALRQLRILTVQDVAAMNEEAIARIGMGARALKDKATAFLEAANGPGKLSEETNALRVRVAEQDAIIKDLAEKVRQLAPSAPPAAPRGETISL